MEIRAFYSPGQVYIGTFLGGPLAAIYYLSVNFKQLGNDAAKVSTIGVGLLVSMGLILMLFQLPDDFPNLLIPLLYSGAAAAVARQFQVSKEEKEAVEEYEFISNWKVAGVSLASLISFMAMIFVAVFLFGVEV